MMMNKLLITSLTLLTLASSAHAYQSMDDRVSELEQEMAQIGEQNALGNYGTKFTTASPKGKNGVYLFVDPLYWHTKVGGTEFAATEENGSQVAQVILPQANGVLKGNDFNWDWGVRVGIGANFAHDCWDANINYTWYETNQTTSVIKRFPAAVRTTRLAENIFAQSAKSSYNVNYNNVNLELGRHYFQSKTVSVQPHIGLKAAWLDLMQHIFYTITFPTLNSPFEGTQLKINDKSFLFGIGPRAGINAEWYVGDGFSIAGRLAGALLYGYSRALHHQKADENSNNFGDNLSRMIRSKTHLYVPTAQAFLGLIWERFLFERTKHLTLGAGYEVEYYWRANQMTYIHDTANPNNLTSRRDHIDSMSEDVMFYGLTLKARFDF